MIRRDVRRQGLIDLDASQATRRHQRTPRRLTAARPSRSVIQTADVGRYVLQAGAVTAPPLSWRPRAFRSARGICRRESPWPSPLPAIVAAGVSALLKLTQKPCESYPMGNGGCNVSSGYRCGRRTCDRNLRSGCWRVPGSRFRNGAYSRAVVDDGRGDVARWPHHEFH